MAHYTVYGKDGQWFISRDGRILPEPVFNNRASAHNYAQKMNHKKLYHVAIRLITGVSIGVEPVRAENPREAVKIAKNEFIKSWPEPDAVKIANENLIFEAF
jgi:hypothetical protein